MSVRRATTQLLPARSVHLRIVPRPADLSESREIFRVLKRFGEIDVFKSLRYEYHNPADNIALAIFRDSTAAQKALDASPIRFALEKVDHHPSNHETDPQNELEDEDAEDAETIHSKKPPKDGIDEILRPSTLLIRTEPTEPVHTTTPQTSTPPAMPFDPPTPSPTAHTRTKWFQVTVDRSRAVHQDFVERQPFWKQFHPQKSLAQEDLAKKVPHIGLSDVSKRPPNAHRTPNKVLRLMSEYVERGMPSLRGMAGDSEAERGFRERRGRRGEEGG
ncbi:hypothetical protein BKA63DRAFT_540940 [Paraphoma chrysanthemicola]|nr:hypothetical protein BKA63DRAFT_540940 [Paraphoma chrysanthemicola]